MASKERQMISSPTERCAECEKPLGCIRHMCECVELTCSRKCLDIHKKKNGCYPLP